MPLKTIPEGQSQEKAPPAAGRSLKIRQTKAAEGLLRQPEEPSLGFDPPESFSEAGAVEPQDRWWTGFDDKQLNSLVEKALEENFDLRTAWQRLREARAVAERRSASLFPEIDAFSEAESRRSPGVRGDEEVFSLGMSADYEVDLWGRIRSEAEAERYRADAGLEAYRTAAVSLSAEV
ncbi:MAG: TolC family protein, partial [Desulfosalsimonas sp.]